MKDSKENLILVRDAIKQLLEGDIPDSECGICSNLHILTNSGIVISGLDFYNKLISSWPHFSGNFEYPVPSVFKEYSPRRMYLISRNAREGKYGELRKDLCKHLVDELTKMIENYE